MGVRRPAFDGSFYEGDARALERDVRAHLSATEQTQAQAETVFGAIVPHAGYRYSGPVAGAVYARIRIPATAVVLCPNHTGRGSGAALDPASAWRTPLGDMPVDRRLAARLLELAPRLREDAAAHAGEHSLEVQLPFLQVRRADVALVPVSLGTPDL